MHDGNAADRYRRYHQHRKPHPLGNPDHRSRPVPLVAQRRKGFPGVNPVPWNAITVRPFLSWMSRAG
ncbi:hypothetical protein D2E29_02690 [Mycobacteroides abscessus]|nr:hypothetical protein MA4S0303_4304 [Mycobacteroides abscessus 4S-0303]EIT92496.1 hypothetical protein MA4S0726RB_3832 [Mycobacteroides abscessus 4S-0726-RB]EIT96045.1 hypothetical protein MA4S0726RA_4242 [Mycobacteroides abscessus 4S-0726-RA]EIV60478.1 hypothetical protein MA4S0116S_3380 [Mycobacteroides abscessus 4S-0116-S]ETZ69275.1 hypothetical protein L835_2179 [Mycobacteroides abscessus MAB_110811_1470]ETZ93596.1 hypothetical protein L828_2228 [Mycobacteroides abscessus MAB_030201_1061